MATVSVSGPDSDFLAGLARTLVERRLVACGNIVPGVRSIYRWDGEVADDAEALVLLHTRVALVGAVVDAVNEIHPYDVAQIVATPLVGGDPAYCRWIMESTDAPAD